MNNFLQRRLDEISIEVVAGNHVRKAPLTLLNEVLWLENLPSGCTVTILPPPHEGPFYYLFVTKPIKGDRRYA
jgi:hypothetical protein